MTFNENAWPALPYGEWKDTYATLHLWTQIVGKIRLVQTPWVNHSWHTSFYVTSRGLTTSPIPYESRTFEINFDLIDHKLYLSTSDGQIRRMELYPRSVADLYKELFGKLREMDVNVSIYPIPSETMLETPFDRDTEHASYDAEYVTRFFHVLVQADRVFRLRVRG